MMSGAVISRPESGIRSSSARSVSARSTGWWDSEANAATRSSAPSSSRMFESNRVAM